uniref:Exosome complex exonuclease RRP6 n=1 Tax=Tetraselmis sp. GSL018 TaxID=582737 RepID=A0A061SIC0_9CHLO
MGFTCLMQLSTREADWIVDTIALRSLIGPKLGPIFADTGVLKVLHGADYDIQWLQRDFGIYTANMFDTGQAARVLELPSFGLAYLLSHYCSVKPDKRHQLADWRVRPIPEEMLLYAQTDTHYLLYIHDRLKAELTERENVRTDLRVPVPPASGAPDTALGIVLERSRQICLKLFEKELHTETSYLKDLQKIEGPPLSSEQTAIYAALFGWRDGVARATDESVGYVMPRAVLIKLARDPPESRGRLIAASGASPLVRQHADAILRVIASAKEQAAASVVTGKVTPGSTSSAAVVTAAAEERAPSPELTRAPGRDQSDAANKASELPAEESAPGNDREARAPQPVAVKPVTARSCPPSSRGMAAILGGGKAAAALPRPGEATAAESAGDGEGAANGSDKAHALGPAGSSKPTGAASSGVAKAERQRGKGAGHVGGAGLAAMLGARAPFVKGKGALSAPAGEASKPSPSPVLALLAGSTLAGSGCRRDAGSLLGTPSGEDTFRAIMKSFNMPFSLSSGTQETAVPAFEALQAGETEDTPPTEANAAEAVAVTRDKEGVPCGDEEAAQAGGETGETVSGWLAQKREEMGTGDKEADNGPREGEPCEVDAKREAGFEEYLPMSLNEAHSGKGTLRRNAGQGRKSSQGGLARTKQAAEVVPFDYAKQVEGSSLGKAFQPNLAGQKACKKSELGRTPSGQKGHRGGGRGRGRSHVRGGAAMYINASIQPGKRSTAFVRSGNKSSSRK